ncbi:MAG: HAMP domain-containing histidine kinase [Deltaproteobacteria bacterium]|nr:HAMP domain-containing histidine kinase [Deltaproteobacteria bacterium]
MTIAAQLRLHQHAVTTRWEAEVVREVPVLATLPRATLIDHLPEFLEGLARWIEGDSEGARAGFDALAEGHAVLRQAGGIEIQALTAEYATLRRVIVEQLLEVASPAELADGIVSLNAGLDLAVREGVHRYASARDEVRERFIAILAHDLRDPLAAVELSASMLARTELPAVQQKLVSRIASGSRRMERMINDVLDFARGRLSGGIPIVPVVADMGDICRTALEEANASGSFAATLDLAGDLRGAWDPDRIRQALANLLRNARHHGGGVAVLRAWESEDRHHVFTAVTNHGPLIPAHHLPHLFDPFTRPKGTRAAGLGLGLYIVRQIAIAHGGICRTTSTAEAGTTFLIEWPRVPLEETPGRARLARPD